MPRPGNFPLRPRRSFRNLDGDQVVESVFKRFEQISNDRDRGKWMEDRLNRYAKYRGWLPDKTWPWQHACFTLDTEVLTGSGWKPVGDIGIGERVYSRSRNGHASYETVTGCMTYWVNELVHFTGKSVDLLVTPNHRMIVERPSGRTVFLEAEHFVGHARGGWLPLTSVWRGPKPRKIHGIDARAYVRLLGWYLSEGSACYATKDGRRSPTSLSISQSAIASAAKCEILEHDLWAAGATWKKYDRSYTIHVRSLPPSLVREFRNFGHATEKFIPDAVLRLHPDLLVQLLDTLVLGDGTRRPNGWRSYYTVSRQLADDVQVLVQRIGLRASITHRAPGPGGMIRDRRITGIHDGYLLAINRKARVQIKKLTVKRCHVLLTPVACVEVPPWHTLYVRRNGKALWTGNSNVHVPILQSAELRANAGLYNVLMTTRPLMSPRALNRANVKREQRVGELIDAQLWVDPAPEHAERRFSDMCSSFLQDGNWVALTPWVRDQREIVQVFFRPPVPAEGDINLHIRRLLLGTDGAQNGGLPGRPGLFPPGSSAEPDTNQAAEEQPTIFSRWKIAAPDGPAMAWVYEDDDGGLEIVVRSRKLLHEGPAFINLSISRMFVPTRCANLQPPAPANPEGAPYVFIAADYSLDEVRRLSKDRHEFNWLAPDDLEDIENIARVNSGLPPSLPKDEERLEEQKDEIEGRTHMRPDVNVEAREADGNLPVPMLVCFDRWDVDGDGLAEDVLWVIARDAKKLCEARLLTDKWPADQPYRPLAESCAIPVPGRWYGISFLELGEAIYDLVKSTFDIAYDAAQVAALPFFFYAASSQWRAEAIKLAPGEGYAVPGNPRETVYFPAIPGRDQTWAWTIIGIAMQFFDRQMSLGPLQSGQIPQGRASALRTFGTTAALIQQGDVRADQLLIRLFGGIRQLYRNFHRMNRKLLPRQKEIRVLGYEGPSEQAYQIINLDDIDADMEFDFRPDFLLSNPEVLARALERMLQVTATPIAFQLGATDPDLFYQAVRDYVRALRLDPKKYLKRPDDPGAPPILFEEALSLIQQDRMPFGMPMEGADKHLTKAFAFVNDEAQFALLTTAQVGMLKAWLSQVGFMRARQMAAEAAGQFQQAMLQQGASAAFSGGSPEPAFDSRAELSPQPAMPGEAG